MQWTSLQSANGVVNMESYEKVREKVYKKYYKSEVEALKKELRASIAEYEKALEINKKVIKKYNDFYWEEEGDALFHELRRNGLLQ